MIWFFIAGMIMFAGCWVRRHMTVEKITKEDVEKSSDENGHSDENVSGD